MNSNQRKTGVRRDGKGACSAAQNPPMAPATSSRQISSVVKSAMQDSTRAGTGRRRAHRRIVQRSNRMTALALGHHITRTALTPAALGGHAQFELDFVKAHVRTGVVGNFAVRDPAADVRRSWHPW